MEIYYLFIYFHWQSRSPWTDTKRNTIWKKIKKQKITQFTIIIKHMQPFIHPKTIAVERYTYLSQLWFFFWNKKYPRWRFERPMRVIVDDKRCNTNLWGMWSWWSERRPASRLDSWDFHRTHGICRQVTSSPPSWSELPWTAPSPVWYAGRMTSDLAKRQRGGSCGRQSASQRPRNIGRWAAEMWQRTRHWRRARNSGRISIHTVADIFTALKL